MTLAVDFLSLLLIFAGWFALAVIVGLLVAPLLRRRREELPDPLAERPRLGITEADEWMDESDWDWPGRAA